MIGISACLLGYNCRYDGKNKKNSEILKIIKSEKFLPVCPEKAGGLPVPREPAEIIGGNGFDVLNGKAKVVDSKGVDKTDAFIKGAYITLKYLKAHGIKHCILKDKSPSCGLIELLTDTERKKSAYSDSLPGVTAALLIREGMYLSNL